MLTDPWFYAVAIPALLIIGISKGGFGGGFGIIGVPMLALVIPPTQAAAILLPVLCLMDAVGLGSYRKDFDRRAMRVLVPGALVGIVLGTITFAVTSDDAVRLIVGIIALGFVAWRWLLRNRLEVARERPSSVIGSFWGGLSGYTSFVAHAGGPPLAVYLVPLGLDKRMFVGTTVVYFTVVNYAKLLPYGLLGQFDATNLLASAVLLPLAPVGVVLGVWLNTRLRAELVYGLVYAGLVVTGVKLIWDGSALVR